MSEYFNQASPHGFQSRRLLARSIADFSAVAGVNNKHNIINGHRSFGNIGGQHYLLNALWGVEEGLLLVLREDGRMKRENLKDEKEQEKADLEFRTVGEWCVWVESFGHVLYFLPS